MIISDPEIFLPNVRIILTGEISVGKTTVAQKLVKSLNIQPAGFTTEKIFCENTIVGYSLRDWHGDSRTFAHVDFPKTVSFDRFGVDLSVFNGFGSEILRNSIRSGHLILIDELGIMEQTVMAFCTTAKEILKNYSSYIAVVQKRALGFWADGLNDVKIVEVTPENRDNILQR